MAYCPGGAAVSLAQRSSLRRRFVLPSTAVASAAQVKLPTEPDTQRSLSGRSDVSIGSACSAFSSFSSASCSTGDILSPRNRNRSLTGTVSMPSLGTHKLQSR